MKHTTVFRLVSKGSQTSSSINIGPKRNLNLWAEILNLKDGDLDHSATSIKFLYGPFVAIDCTFYLPNVCFWKLNSGHPRFFFMMNNI